MPDTVWASRLRYRIPVAFDSRMHDIHAAGAAGAMAASSGFSPLAFGAGHKTVKVGMNIPMTGDYAPWGLPGLYGCQIVADNLNAAGGVDIGGDKHKIEIVSYDHGYDIEKAVQGYKKMVAEDEKIEKEFAELNHKKQTKETIQKINSLERYRFDYSEVDCVKVRWVRIYDHLILVKEKKIF